MVVKINGTRVEEVRTVEIKHREYTNLEAWAVILLGTLAGLGWYQLWQ